MADSQDKSLEPELLFTLVKERYGQLLSDEQLTEVRNTTLAQHRLVQPLRAVRLSNDVEPFAAFRPYRSDKDGE